MKPKQLLRFGLFFSFAIIMGSCAKDKTNSDTPGTCKVCHAWIGAEEIATETVCTQSQENSFRSSYNTAEVSCD